MGVEWGSRVGLLVLGVGAALSTGLGKCPVFPPIPDFNIQRITGVWYEVERSFYIMEVAASCTRLNVSLSDNGHLHIVVSTVNRWSGASSTTFGVGIPSWAGAASFRYKVNSRLPYALGRLMPGAGQYHVLLTDYDEFALLWSCSSISVAYTDHMWLLGRSRELDAALRARIYAAMSALSLDIDRLILAKNNNCTLYDIN